MSIRPVFEHSRVIIYPMPEVFILYFKKYNYYRYLDNVFYQTRMCMFIKDIIELSRQHMWQIDRDINGHDLSLVIKNTAIGSHLYRDHEEYTNLLSVINKSAKEFTKFISDYNYEGNKIEVLKFDENMVYIEIENKGDN